MNNNLLPIGSVVKIYNNDRKYIILGTFCKIDNKDFTYYCCLYPYGLINENYKVNNKVGKYDIYINQDDIEKIFFLGNVNSEV